MGKFNKIIAIFLCISLLLFLFKNRESNNYYMEEINNLNQINEYLLDKNDSIMSLNKRLDTHIKILDSVIKVREDSLKIITKNIKLIRDEKNKINNYVNNLDINGVDRALTEYLEGR